MIDSIFDSCVRLLVVLAKSLGMSYKAINVWIFVILWPAFTLALIAFSLWQQMIIGKLLRQFNERRLTNT